MSAIEKWTTAEWPDLGMVLVSTFVVYVGILLYTRLVGLRSFSKMSAADFAMTVAVGSLFASTISSPSPTLAVGLFSLAALFLGQWLLARARLASQRFNRLVDNQPLLLMSGGRFLDDNLQRSQVTRDDVYCKLREANALGYDQVLAVIFETTGDISVIHSCDQDARLEPEFVKNVIGKDQIPSDKLTGTAG